MYAVLYSAVASYGFKHVMELAQPLQETQTIRLSGTELHTQTVQVQRDILDQANTYQTTVGRKVLVMRIPDTQSETMTTRE